MLVVESKDVRNDLVKYSFNQKQVTEASHLLVICIQKDIIDNDVIDYYSNIKDIRNTSETILKPYREDLINMMKNMTVKERQLWSTNQAYIALGNLMTVCAIENIDSCPMEGFISSMYDKLLHLEDMGLKSVLLLPIGYRAEDDMFSNFKKVRKPLEDAVIDF